VIILALDLASKTGVAVGSASPIAFTEVLGATGTAHGQRFLNAFTMTRRLIKKYSPDLIALEAPIGVHGGGSKKRPEVLMGLRGCVMAAAHYDKVPFEQYEVSTIRVHFLGKGNGRLKRVDAKAATIKQCGILGWQVENDDEADSCALWSLAMARHSRSFGFSTTPMGAL